MKDEKDSSGADAAAVDTAGSIEALELSHAEEIKVLQQFGQQLNRMSPRGRQAAIYWCADYFLGIKLWHADNQRLVDARLALEKIYDGAMADWLGRIPLKRDFIFEVIQVLRQVEIGNQPLSEASPSVPSAAPK